MKSIEEIKELIPIKAGELDLGQKLVSFLMCMIVAFVVLLVYINRSYSLIGKNHIGSILPLQLSQTTRRIQWKNPLRNATRKAKLSIFE